MSPTEAEVYVEHSLSEFGNPDVIFILTYGDGHRQAVYVEAKLTGFLTSARPGGREPKYIENSSSILHELFLKAVFQRALQERCAGNPRCALGLTKKVYASDPENGRSLGEDPQVIALAMRLAECRSTFLAITAEKLTAPAASDICREIQTISQRNDHKADWLNDTYLLTWDTIGQTAKARLSDLTEALTWNHSKLFGRYQVLEGPDYAVLQRFWTNHELIDHGERTGHRRTLYHTGDRRAFATYWITGAAGKRWLQLRLTGFRTGTAKTEPFTIHWDDIDEYTEERKHPELWNLVENRVHRR